MGEHQRQLLAKQLRENWLTKGSGEQNGRVEDDSLTNLTWLQNMNVMSLTSPSYPDALVHNNVLASDPLSSLRRTVSLEPNYNYHLSSGYSRQSPPPSLSHMDGSQSPTMSNHSANSQTNASTLADLAELMNEEQREKYRTNTSLKPPFLYQDLIAMAIRTSDKQKLSLKEICDWLKENFSYFQLSAPNWESEVNHCLTLNKCFQKVPRRKDELHDPARWRLSANCRKMFETADKKRLKRQQQSSQHNTMTQNFLHSTALHKVLPVSRRLFAGQKQLCGFESAPSVDLLAQHHHNNNNNNNNNHITAFQRIHSFPSANIYGLSGNHNAQSLLIGNAWHHPNGATAYSMYDANSMPYSSLPNPTEFNIPHNLFPLSACSTPTPSVHSQHQQSHLNTHSQSQQASCSSDPRYDELDDSQCALNGTPVSSNNNCVPYFRMPMESGHLSGSNGTDAVIVSKLQLAQQQQQQQQHSGGVAVGGGQSAGGSPSMLLPIQCKREEDEIMNQFFHSSGQVEEYSNGVYGSHSRLDDSVNTSDPLDLTITGVGLKPPDWWSTSLNSSQLSSRFDFTLRRGSAAPSPLLGADDEQWMDQQLNFDEMDNLFSVN